MDKKRNTGNTNQFPISSTLKKDQDSIEFYYDESDEDVYNSGEEDNMQNTRLLIAKSAEKEKQRKQEEKNRLQISDGKKQELQKKRLQIRQLELLRKQEALKRQQMHLEKQKHLKSLKEKSKTPPPFPASKPRQPLVKQQSVDSNQEKEKSGGGGLLGFGIFGRLSKKEQNHRNYLSTKAIKLPKNFANMVLDEELKIDSGCFNIDTINTLLQLYSKAVEYYSGMNDEKYIYFTERIQNMLCKPDILNMMKKTEEAQQKKADPNKKTETKAGGSNIEEEKKEEDPVVDRANMNQGDKIKFEQEAFEKRKKARNETLQKLDRQEILNDPVYKLDAQIIEKVKESKKETIKLLKKDEFDQKDSLQKRLAQRKLRQKKSRANKSQIDLDNPDQDKHGEYYHRGGAQSVLVTKPQDKHELLDMLNKLQDDVDQDKDVVVESDDDDLPPINNQSTLTGSGSNNNNFLQVGGAHRGPSQSVLQPVKGFGGGYSGGQGGSSFNMMDMDMQSQSSAYFLKDDEIEAYEEKMEEKIKELWSSMEQQNKDIQKQYQIELERIIEENAESKFEQLAEIKVMYKKTDPSDTEKLKERDEEIKKVKSEMDSQKKEKLEEAKNTMEAQKDVLDKEKKDFFQNFKGTFKQEQDKSFTTSPDMSMNSSPIGIKEGHLSLGKTNSQMISGDLKIAPVSVGTPKMGGSGRNSPASPTFNFGGLNLDAEEEELKIQKSNTEINIDNVDQQKDEEPLDQRIEQDFSELEKNLAQFQQEQNGDGNEDDDDSYPDRRFSFAPEPVKPKLQAVQNQDDMSDLKAQLKAQMMKQQEIIEDEPAEEDNQI